MKTLLIIILAIYMFIGYCALKAMNKGIAFTMRIDQKYAKENDPTKTGFFEGIPIKIWQLLIWPLYLALIGLGNVVLTSKPEERFKVRKQIVELYGTTKVLLPDSEADKHGSYGDYD